MQALGLRNVFSLDFRVEDDDTVHLIEFEVCPGLPCFELPRLLPLAMAARPRRCDGRNRGEPTAAIRWRRDSGQAESQSKRAHSDQNGGFREPERSVRLGT
jgi:hypothetical protein